MNKMGMFGAAIVLIAIIVVAAILLGRAPASQSGATTTIPSTGAGSGSTLAPILITDPPTLPAGTQALVIVYSNVTVHISGTASSGWVNATGKGSVNLLSVVNSSQLIGEANVPTNSVINLVRLNVTSANITINGTVYNVTLPNPSLTIAVTGKTKINQTTGILIDMAPTIAAVYKQNGTTFIMAPAVKAVVVTNLGLSPLANIGLKVGLAGRARSALAVASPNITITSASIHTSGNVTSVTVTVRDNSNTSVVLNNLFISGFVSVVTKNTGSANATAGRVVGIGGILTGINASARFNASTAARANFIRSLQSLDFVITNNGSLALPSSSTDFQGSGYVLTPGKSVTLRFNGNITYASGLFQAGIARVGVYHITVIGQGGASASTVVNIAG